MAPIGPSSCFDQSPEPEENDGEAGCAIGLGKLGVERDLAGWGTRGPAQKALPSYKGQVPLRLRIRRVFLIAGRSPDSVLHLRLPTTAKKRII
jgi:hypothetical protein